MNFTMAAYAWEFETFVLHHDLKSLFLLYCSLNRIQAVGSKSDYLFELEQVFGIC